MGTINIPLRETHLLGKGTRELIVGASQCSALAPLGVNLTGITDAAEGFCFVRRHPHFGHLLACVGGQGEVWGEDGWTRLTPDAAYWTPPTVPHAYRTVPGQPWRLIWLHLANTRPASSPLPQVLAMDARLLEGAIDGLYREVNGSSAPAVLHHWANLVSLYAERAVYGPGTDMRLRPLWAVVDTNLSYPWTVEELAARAGLSGEHLRRLCRRQLGRSPMQHVTQLRMRRAAALLSSGFQTIDAVAPQVGYDNPFAFSTAFKRCLGLPPSEYRARVRSGDS